MEFTKGPLTGQVADTVSCRQDRSHGRNPLGTAWPSSLLMPHRMRRAAVASLRPCSGHRRSVS